MPDMKKPIENPELVEALAALHQENTPQNQGRVLELVLHHAVLLAPAVVTPPRPSRGARPLRTKRPPSSSN